MEQILRFDQTAERESIVFLRLTPGTAVLPGEQCMLVQKKEGEWRQRAFPPWETRTIENDGVWYGISFSRITQQIGFSDLIFYVIPDIPGQIFRLGFHGEMNIRAACVRALFPHMENRESITMLELLHLFKGSMHECAVHALETVLGPGIPELGQIIAKKDQIAQETESALFWLLYRNGLCIKPHSFAIRGFAPPLMQ